MPNLIRVPQQYAVSFAYNNVKQAMQTLGEEIIMLKMFHVNSDAETQPRCANCYDDVYKSNEDPYCGYCYGTTFQGGVKEVWRAWAIVADQTEDEEIKKGGVWQNEDHQVQAEAHPALNENDYIVRIPLWDSRKQAPLEIGGYYKVGAVSPITVRTGARFGGTNVDRIAQKFMANLLPKNEVIYKYDIRKEVTFPRYDLEPR